MAYESEDGKFIIKDAGELGKPCVYCDKNIATEWTRGINGFEDTATGVYTEEDWAICKRCKEVMEAQMRISFGMFLQQDAIGRGDLKAADSAQELIKKLRKKIDELTKGIGGAFAATLTKNRKGGYDVYEDDYKEKDTVPEGASQ